ncbi:MAG: hypothetical protein M5U01_08140 [Ardenticatenaceae bacterium]|nr:hypothetical protein [Ardenticatenaceae bacterium]HBY98690.1 hypothetical protein [Chloroflexota bacterium]
MIDDPARTKELIGRMEAQVPIPARPTSSLVRVMRDKGAKFSRDRILYIKRIFYGGDEGGILCDVTPSEESTEAYVVSLTHLEIPSRHPLAREIRAYQRERVRRIRAAGSSSQSRSPES